MSSFSLPHTSVPYMCTNNNDTIAPTRMFSKQHEMSASSEAQKFSTVDSKPSLPRKESCKL